ncbi:rod shape-determining protein MreC [Ramlibacter tataouinensis]|uniref:Cell shape-determining protein MreC n=1 Tax=Ramlibacter tataouinensis (strain ATCC BAA-407 / DSM 14655 / LMG 21543 / TTB310) TaxID=365046 RepID=F5Y5E4_RAMTT|nr:rod shape-determining protein MreC [Ramlibacter tataouinensis]AEG91454.1 Candidate cell shape-determining protein [Ramlibacter tataouinensis TTB310]
MPLGTLDRAPPPFFKQGPSAASKLMVCSALALFLMVADTRFRITQPLRAAVASVLYPVQWLALRPVLLVRHGASYFQSMTGAQSAQAEASLKLAQQAQRAGQVEQLALENERLRKLLDLRDRISTPSQAAEVLYDAADPYTRKVIIDKGLAQGVEPGSPVVDEAGVLGQVTRVHPLISEVTLVTDADNAIPVLNTRTGARSVAYGDPSGSHAGSLELRFMADNADVQAGDLLTTSGVDGIYPAGLPVARVAKVERRADSVFARIHCTPQALVDGARHVMVLKPISAQIPPRPRPQPQDAALVRKGVKK